MKKINLRKSDERVAEVTMKDYQEALAQGIDPEYATKPGSYLLKRGDFLQRHPNFKPKNRKVRTSIRFDVEVINYFKQLAAQPNAEPYQRQINRVLREWIEHQQARKIKRA